MKKLYLPTSWQEPPIIYRKSDVLPIDADTIEEHTEPNPDYVEAPLKVSMLKVVGGEVVTGVAHSTEEIGKFLKKD